MHGDALTASDARGHGEDPIWCEEARCVAIDGFRDS